MRIKQPFKRRTVRASKLARALGISLAMATWFVEANELVIVRPPLEQSLITERIVDEKPLDINEIVWEQIPDDERRNYFRLITPEGTFEIIHKNTFYGLDRPAQA